SRRRHTRSYGDWSSDVCSSDLQALLALADPYDPAQNAPYRLHDASLYHGRYYLYFGPTPVALLYLPLRAVGVAVTDAVASSLFRSEERRVGKECRRGGGGGRSN